MFVLSVAEQFQLLGITALIYDPRSPGTSEGTPRNEIDPMKQVEDYSDAFTFLSTLLVVDSDRIGFWGMSFSGTIALCAAALDKRAKFVIAICPLCPSSAARVGSRKCSQKLPKTESRKSRETPRSTSRY